MTMLEVCVDSWDGVNAAVEGGADRIELCSSLAEGGLTPSAGLMAVATKVPVPVFAMIRPRSGLFCFSETEVEMMFSDIAVAHQTGLAGVVLGVQSDDGALDLPTLSRLVQAAGSLGKTLHRVIDVVPDPLMAIEQAIELGFDRVLTSGAQPTALEGLPLIRQMIDLASGRISVMPGCGIVPETVPQVLRATGADEIHASCSRPADGDPAFSDFDPLDGRSVTSKTQVQQMVAAIGR